jgi:hypothetical protein
LIGEFANPKLQTISARMLSAEADKVTSKTFRIPAPHLCFRHACLGAAKSLTQKALAVYRRL